MDYIWIAIAFSFGFIIKQFGLPPLIGYLAAGFALNAMGLQANDTIDVKTKLPLLSLHGKTKKPLPEHLDVNAILEAIHPRKDVNDRFSVDLKAYAFAKEDLYYITQTAIMKNSMNSEFEISSSLYLISLYFYTNKLSET